MKCSTYIFIILFLFISFKVHAYEPSSQYLAMQDEQRQFKELMNFYSKARHALEHPIQIHKLDLARGVEFNFEPTIVALDQGASNFTNMKVMIQITANLL